MNPPPKRAPRSRALRLPRALRVRTALSRIDPRSRRLARRLRPPSAPPVRRHSLCSRCTPPCISSHLISRGSARLCARAQAHQQPGDGHARRVQVGGVWTSPQSRRGPGARQEGRGQRGPASRRPRTSRAQLEREVQREGGARERGGGGGRRRRAAQAPPARSQEGDQGRAAETYVSTVIFR